MMNDLFAPIVKNRIKNGEWWIGDCLELMKDIPDDSVDMVLCDLPYGTIACKWDTVIPFEPLWREYHRIAKERAAIVLTASQPFTSALVMSNVDNFKYCWVWRKTKAANFKQAKNSPLKRHEDICVFSKGLVGHASQTDKRMTYNPQGVINCDKFIKRNKVNKDELKIQRVNGVIKGFKQTTENYPDTLLEFGSVHNPEIHPTQKPVALFEYLIKTYTNEGDLVLDNTAGSGTTAVAAENTSRRWICIERDQEYSRKAIGRIHHI